MSGIYGLSVPTTTATHIWLDEKGIARVDEANTKVTEIALDVLAHGWSPQEIHVNHPHLSLAQIHSALAYYYDHQPELDRQIEEDFAKAESIRHEQGDSPLRKRLAALRKA